MVHRLFLFVLLAAMQPSWRLALTVEGFDFKLSVIPNASWFFKRPKVALDQLSMRVDGYSSALFERTQQVLDSFANSPPVTMPAFASAAADTVTFDWSNSRPPSPWWAENRPAQLRQRWAAARDTQVLRSNADASGGDSGSASSSGSSDSSRLSGRPGNDSSGSSGSGGGSGGNNEQNGEPIDGGEPPIPAAHVAQAKAALASAGVQWANEPRISALSAGFCNWVYRVEVDTLESAPDAVNESNKSPMAAAVSDFIEWSAPKRPPITSTSTASRTEIYVVKIFSELAKIRQSPETRGVVDVVAASLHLAPQVVASTEDLIVHVLVEGRELSEADLALPPPLQQTQVPRLSGSDATALGNKESAAAGTSAREDMNLSNDNNGSLQSGTSTAQARPPPRMGRLLDSMVSKLANRLLSDAQDLPAALHQLQRDLPLKLDRVQAAAQLVAHFTAAEAEVSAKFAAKRAADAMAARQALRTAKSAVEDIVTKSDDDLIYQNTPAVQDQKEGGNEKGDDSDELLVVAEALALAEANLKEASRLENAAAESAAEAATKAEAAAADARMIEAEQQELDSMAAATTGALETAAAAARPLTTKPFREAVAKNKKTTPAAAAAPAPEEQSLDPLELGEAIAKKLASLHALTPLPPAFGEAPHEPVLWSSTSKMLQHIAKKPHLLPSPFTVALLEEESAWAKQQLEGLPLGMVLGHGDFKPTNVMLASQPGEPIDVQFIDFELAGPNYRGYDIYKLFRRGQPQPPPSTDATDTQGDVLVEPVLNTTPTMPTDTLPTATSSTTTTASSEGSHTSSTGSASRTPPQPPPAVEPDTRALRSFVSAYLQAIDANEQMCGNNMNSQGDRHTEKAAAARAINNAGAKSSNQEQAGAAIELASASAAARALLATVVETEDMSETSTTTVANTDATASPISSSSSSTIVGRDADDVAALESLMAEVSIFEPLTWFEAAVFFLFAIQEDEANADAWTQLAIHRWSNYLTSKPQIAMHAARLRQLNSNPNTAGPMATSSAPPQQQQQQLNSDSSPPLQALPPPSIPKQMPRQTSFNKASSASSLPPKGDNSPSSSSSSNTMAQLAARNAAARKISAALSSSLSPTTSSDSPSSDNSDIYNKEQQIQEAGNEEEESQPQKIDASEPWRDDDSFPSEMDDRQARAGAG